MIFKLFRKGIRTAKTRSSIRRIRTVESLVEMKAMLFNTEGYHVAMLDNLWNKYEGKQLINFCETLIFYCNFKNAFNEKPVDEKEKKKLLVSLKYENDEVITYCTYHDGKITYLFPAQGFLF